jgi:hypothetical protein
MKKLLSLIILFSLTLNAMEEPSAPSALNTMEEQSAPPAPPAYDEEPAMNPADPNTWLSTWVYDYNKVLISARASHKRRIFQNIHAISSDNKSEDDSIVEQSPHPLSQDLKYRHKLISMEVMLKNKKKNECFYSQHLSWAVAEDGSITPTSDSSCWKIKHDNSKKPTPELWAEGQADLEYKVEHVWPAILETVKNTTYEPNVLLTKACENTNETSIKYSVTKKVNDTKTLLQPVTEMTFPLYGEYKKEYTAEIKNEDGPIVLCVTAPSVSTPLRMQDLLDQLTK